MVINSEIPSLSETVRADPVFYSLVYPEVMRQVLTKAIDRGGDPDADDETWTTLWLCFGRKLHPMHDNPPRWEEQEEVEEWVEAVVKAFCEQHTLRDRYIASGHGERE